MGFPDCPPSPPQFPELDKNNPGARQPGLLKERSKATNPHVKRTFKRFGLSLELEPRQAF
jgi:hypothetical protein